MGRLKPPREAKLFCGLLISPSCDTAAIYKALEKLFGSIDSESETVPFNLSDYYTAEMGPDLKRQFISFEKTIPMDTLARIKKLTNALEEKWAAGEKRTVNIDPGYLNLYQIVLASTKKFFHRIYLGDEIYAEVTLVYRKSHGWMPLEWTYPDYCAQEARSYFARLRDIYNQTSKTPNLGGNPSGEGFSPKPPS
jgi:hypothetical protein